jgi:hypothetical protein
MKAFSVVVDSSCIIGLTHIGLFNRLTDIFQEISIPDFVYHEVVLNGKGIPGADGGGYSNRLACTTVGTGYAGS